MNLLGAHIKFNSKQERQSMAAIIVILLVLWALGFIGLSVGGELIHILLVAALIAFIYNMVTRERA